MGIMGARMVCVSVFGRKRYQKEGVRKEVRKGVRKGFRQVNRKDARKGVRKRGSS